MGHKVRTSINLTCLALLLFVVIGCKNDKAKDELLMRHVSSVDDLRPSEADSILIARFFSSTIPTDSGLYSFRNDLRDSTRLKHYIDTVTSDTLRFRAQMLHDYLMCSRAEDLKGVSSALERYLDLPVSHVSQPMGSLFFYTLSTYLRYQQRHIESLAATFKSIQVADDDVIMLSNGYAQVAANLLQMSSLENSTHYFEVAKNVLPISGFEERQSVLLCNWGITESLKGENISALHLLKESLQVCPNEDTSRQRYILGKIARAYASTRLDSALFFARAATKLNHSTSHSFQYESLLDYADFLADLKPSQAHAIYDSLYGMSTEDQDVNGFVTQVRILEGLIHTLHEERAGYTAISYYADQIDSLILKNFSSFDDASQLHYLEFTQELIDSRIAYLLNEKPDTTTLREIIRLIEWDRQIDMELFEGPERQGKNVYDDPRVVEHLTHLNEFNFIPGIESEQRWLNIADIIMDSLSLAPHEHRPVSIQTVDSFSLIANKIKNLDSTSILIVHPIGGEYLAIVLDNKGEDLYRLNRSTIDSIYDSIRPLVDSGKLEDLPPIDLFPQDRLNQLRSEVVILASAELELFPFEMIKAAKDKPLYEAHALAYCFSILNSRIDDPYISTESISAFAFTDIDDLNLELEVSELPGSYYEVMKVKEIFPQTRLYTGTNFNHQNLNNELQTSSLVYIASHNIYDLNNRLSSFITNKSEGLATRNAVNRHSSPTSNCELIVLSACSPIKGMHIPNYGISSTVRKLKNNMRNTSIIAPTHDIIDSTNIILSFIKFGTKSHINTWRTNTRRNPNIRLYL